MPVNGKRKSGADTKKQRTAVETKSTAAQRQQRPSKKKSHSTIATQAPPVNTSTVKAQTLDESKNTIEVKVQTALKGKAAVPKRKAKPPLVCLMFAPFSLFDLVLTSRSKSGKM